MEWFNRILLFEKTYKNIKFVVCFECKNEFEIFKEYPLLKEFEHINLKDKMCKRCTKITLNKEKNLYKEMTNIIKMNHKNDFPLDGAIEYLKEKY